MAVGLDPGDVREDQRGEELAEHSTAHDQHGAKPLNAGEQANLDQMEAGLRNGDSAPEPSQNSNNTRPRTAGSTRASRKGERADSFTQAMKRGFSNAGAFAGRHKKKLWAGGGIAGILLSTFMLFIALLPLKIEALVKAILEKRVEQPAERAVETRIEKIMEQYFEKSVTAGVERSAASDAAFDKLIVANGSVVKDFYKTIRLNNFDKKLTEEQGIKFQKGKKFGTVDIYQDGERIGNFGSSEARGIMNQAVRTQTKWYQILKRKHLRLWYRQALGIQKWKFFSGENDEKKATTEVRNNFIDDAASLDNVLEPGVIADMLEEGTGSSADNESEDDQIKQTVSAANEAGVEAGEKASPSLTSQALAKIIGDAAAEKLTAFLGKISTPLLVISLIDIASRIDHYVTSGAADTTVARFHQLEYAGQFAEWLIVSDEIKDGTTANGSKVSGAEVNAVMEQTGDPSKSCAFQQLFENSVNTKCQDVATGDDGKAAPFSREVNGGVNGPIAATFNTLLQVSPIFAVEHDAYTLWYNTGRHVMDIVNTVLGGITSFVLKAIEIVFPPLSWLLEQGGKAFLQITQFLLNRAISGIESDGDLFNGLDAGGSATGQGFMSWLGAPSISTSEATSINNEIAAEQTVESQKLSLGTKLFSTDYTDSLVNKVAAVMPGSMSDATNQAGGYLASMFTSPFHWFATFLGSIPVPGLQFAMADSSANTNLYPGIQQSNFTDAELNLPVNEASLQRAAQNAAKRTGMQLNQITIDDIDPSQDCQDNIMPVTGTVETNVPNMCKLDVVAFQTIYDSQTTTDDGGLNDSGSDDGSDSGAGAGSVAGGL